MKIIIETNKLTSDIVNKLSKYLEIRENMNDLIGELPIPAEERYDLFSFFVEYDDEGIGNILADYKAENGVAIKDDELFCLGKLFAEDLPADVRDLLLFCSVEKAKRLAYDWYNCMEEYREYWKSEEDKWDNLAYLIRVRKVRNFDI